MTDMTRASRVTSGAAPTTVAPAGGELSLELIIEAALEIIEEAGVSGLTMRRLGARLGYSNMAVYRHIENRDALVLLAADALIGRHAPTFERTTGSWEQRVRKRVRRIVQLSAEHPWAVAAIHGAYPTRDIDTPNVLAARIAHARELRRDGFDGEKALLAQTLIESTMVGIVVTAGYRAHGLWRGAPDEHARAPKSRPTDSQHEKLATDALIEALRKLRSS